MINSSQHARLIDHTQSSISTSNSAY